jgi:hypothetical protein
MGYGVETRFAVDTDQSSNSGIGPFDNSSTAMEFLSCTLALRGSWYNAAGMRGTRSRQSERTRENVNYVNGEVTQEPTPNEIDFWLPYMQGGTESANSFPLAETLQSFQCLVDRVEKRHRYFGCKIDQWEFSAQQQSALQLRLMIEALSETETDTAFPTGLTEDRDVPYMFFDGVFNIEGSARAVAEFSLLGNNFLDVDRFMNNQNRPALYPRDRVISTRIMVPYLGNSALHNITRANLDSSASYVFTNGARSLTMTLGKIFIPAQTPPIVNRQGELFYAIEGEVQSVAGADEVVFTNDTSA